MTAQTLEQHIAAYLTSVPIVRCAQCKKLLGVIGAAETKGRMHCMECDAYLEVDFSKDPEVATHVLEAGRSPSR